MGGLTKKEQIVMDLLIIISNGLTVLDTFSDDDKKEFLIGIHQLQGLLAVKIVERDNPQR